VYTVGRGVRVRHRTALLTGVRMSIRDIAEDFPDSSGTGFLQYRLFVRSLICFQLLEDCLDFGVFLRDSVDRNPAVLCVYHVLTRHPGLQNFSDFLRVSPHFCVLRKPHTSGFVQRRSDTCTGQRDSMGTQGRFSGPV